MKKVDHINQVYAQIAEANHTPYILVRVDNNTRVPMHLVKDGRIILNISMIAASNLYISEHGITFGARFSQKHFDIDVPLANISALYARETGEGVWFDMDMPPMAAAMAAEKVVKETPAPATPTRPALRVVK